MPDGFDSGFFQIRGDLIVEMMDIDTELRLNRNGFSIYPVWSLTRRALALLFHLFRKIPFLFPAGGGGCGNQAAKPDHAEQFPVKSHAFITSNYHY